MRSRPILFALPILLLCAAATGAIAAEGAEPKKDEGPTNVELPPILAPMSSNGRLDGYAYITIALTPSGRDKILMIREKVPFLRDAFLRELNKGSIVKADDPKAVDTDAIKPRLTVRLDQILPHGTVSELKFEQIVMSPSRAD